MLALLPTQQAPNTPRQLGGKNTPWPTVSAGLALPPTNRLSQAPQAKPQMGQNPEEKEFQSAGQPGWDITNIGEHTKPQE